MSYCWYRTMLNLYAYAPLFSRNFRGCFQVPDENIHMKKCRSRIRTATRVTSLLDSNMSLPVSQLILLPAVLMNLLFSNSRYSLLGYHGMKMADPHIDFLRDVMGSRCTSADPIERGGGGSRMTTAAQDVWIRKLNVSITTGWMFWLKLNNNVLNMYTHMNSHMTGV